MDRLIQVKVKGSHLIKDSSTGGVQGEANITTLRIEFDEGWDEFTKTLYFLNAKGELPVKIDLTEDNMEAERIYCVLIPGEALSEGGWFSFIVEGSLDDIVQRSVEGKLYAEPTEDYAGAVYTEDGRKRLVSIDVSDAADAVTFTSQFSDGSTRVRVITKDADGNPNGMTDDGRAVDVTWTEVD